MSDLTLGNIASAAYKFLFTFGPANGLAGCNHKQTLTETEDASSSEPINVKKASPPPAPKPGPRSDAAAKALISWAPTIDQAMDAHDSANWQMASWSNGDPFNCTWQADNVSFSDSIMTLTLDDKGCPGSCDSKPYASGEYRTLDEAYRYGYYETRMKAAAGKGLVSSFFVYAGTWGKPDHSEIDFEFLGKDCGQAQLNHYVEGRGKHEKMVALGFDACSEFHNYGFRWAEDSIIWYVDGSEVHRVNEDPATPEKEIPHGKTKIMVNFWPGKGVDGWLGPFSYAGKPLEAQYDWIKFSPLDKGQAPSEAQPAPAAAPKASATSAAGILKLEDIIQGSFGFNGGKLTENNGSYSFSADHARDPGFGLVTGDHDLAGRNLLKFEIKGSFKKHAGYARFIAQVYSDKDNDSSPSVSLDPVPVGKGWTEVVVDLRSKIGRAKKVQFLLVTDSGSCNVEIRGLRFE
ncbi:family 16 glycosylhydrolase [Candidatus Margulisiibacteriota bacterium]